MCTWSGRSTRGSREEQRRAVLPFDRSGGFVLEGYKVTPKEHGTASFADLGHGPDGTVYMTYLIYEQSAHGRRVAAQIR